MKKIARLIGSLLMVVMILLPTFPAYAASSNQASATSTQAVITLVRGSGGDFSATIPIKSKTSNAISNASTASGQITMQLERFTGTNTYELFYSVTVFGDYLVGFQGNFKVANTSVLSPVTYKNTNVDEYPIPATTIYTQMVPGTFTIPSSVAVVKTTASNLYVTLLEAGTVSASPLIDTWQVN